MFNGVQTFKQLSTTLGNRIAAPHHQYASTYMCYKFYFQRLQRNQPHRLHGALAVHTTRCVNVYFSFNYHNYIRESIISLCLIRFSFSRAVKLRSVFIVLLFIYYFTFDFSVHRKRLDFFGNHTF